VGTYVDERGTDILDLLAAGESETAEFRSRFSAEEDLARDISALANSKGGYLFFGVDNQGKPFGMSPAEAQRISSRLLVVSESLLPAPVTANTINAGGLIVFAYIPPVEKHLRPVTTASGKAYYRRGAKTVAWPRRRPPPSTISRRVFVAMSFRTEEEPALVDYYGAMRRAVEAAQLPIELVRIDRVEGDYEISQEITNQIDSCDFVIADFTLSPRNVYFEAGYARGRDKPIIRCARRDTVLEFDVRNWRTIFYRNATELEERLVPAIEEQYSQL
jgi:hypothetical protein